MSNKFNENSKVIDAMNDAVVGKYMKYIFYGYLEERQDLTLVSQSGYGLTGLNWFYDMLCQENAKQYFLDETRPDVSVFHFSHNSNAQTALVLAGGGLTSVHNINGGIPVAKDLYDRGYDVFCLVYGVKQDAYKEWPSIDLNHAVKFMVENSQKLNYSMEDYSIIGSSAAGYIVGQYGTQNLGYRHYGNPKPSVLCLMYPVIDLSISDNNTRRYALGGENTTENFQKFSVNYNIDSEYPPTFFVHSKDDPIVPIENCYRLKKQLELYNVPYYFKEYQTGRHGWSVGYGLEMDGWLDNFVDFWKKYSNHK